MGRVMPKYELYICIHLVQFVPQTIIRVGTNRPRLHRSGYQGEVVYISALLTLSLLYAACCDDKINEQRILRAAVSNARCGRLQGGKPHADKSEQWEGLENRYFLRTPDMDDPNHFAPINKSPHPSLIMCL